MRMLRVLASDVNTRPPRRAVAGMVGSVNTRLSTEHVASVARDVLGMRAVLRVLIPVLAVAVLAACAINPVTHRPEFVVMSAEEERQLGAEEAKRVEQSISF